MNTHQEDIKAVLRWLIPSSTQIAAYIFITFFTAILCSQDFINSFLFAQHDFNPIRGAISYLDLGLQKIVGEKIAGGLSLGIFWGAVGLLVNIFWWLGSSFSTELNNDLVFSKYVHPKDADPNAPLREFITRTVIRALAGIAGLLYLNFVISSGLPTIANRFADIFALWDWGLQWQNLVVTILLEMLMLHGIVVLTRVALLRRQAID